MLSQRICGLVLVRFGVAVQSFGFERFQPIGRPEFSVRYLGHWGVDEIVLIDATARKERSGPNLELLKVVANQNLTPINFGGGISSVVEACEAVRAGADKISINSAAIQNPEMVRGISREIGSQSCVVSIDVIRHQERFVVWDCESRRPTETPLSEHLRRCENLGAGEFLVTSVTDDGMGQGCDLNMAEVAVSATSVPIVFAGGVGEPRHVEELFRNVRVGGVVVGNRFSHTEHSVAVLKAALHGRIPARFDHAFNYDPAFLDRQGRLVKLNDELLEEMLFSRIEDEEV